MLTLDPRSRLMIVFVLSSLAVILQSLPLFAVLFLVTLVVVKALGGDLQVLYRLRKMMWIFIILFFVQSLFNSDGRVLLQVGDMHFLTTGGVVRGLGLVFRITIIVLSASLLMSVNSRQLIQGLVQIRVPYEIAFMVQLAIRFLPLLQEELKDALVAIQLRGIELEKLPLRKRVKVYTYLFMPVLAGVIGKAQELSTSMEMKAFRASPVRGSHLQLKLGVGDYLTMCMSTLVFIVFLIVHF